MAGIIMRSGILFAVFLISGLYSSVIADDVLAELILNETDGITRQLEYIEVSLQLPLDSYDTNSVDFIALRKRDKHVIQCQVVKQKIFKKQNIAQIRLVFPVSIEAYQTDSFLIKTVDESISINSDLSYSGSGFELVIDNAYYRTDLTKSSQSEGKNHESGQLRELLIKMDFDVLLQRTENRIHWAPNFQNQQEDYYSTIAGWERPEQYTFINGPYLIRTMRRDRAPDHPEILLTANYSFYAGLPYFKFYSSMEVEQDVILSLLRNDEMTMDSLFTHIAYQIKPGVIVDLAFSERHQVLDNEPISNEAPWLCFYNENKGYAFGSIRIKYDNTSNWGLPSPTYFPHTKISDGAAGGKYWNRRLIHDHPVFVAAGSRYIEENAYIVFKINKEDKFSEIEKWADQIRHPVRVITR